MLNYINEEVKENDFTLCSLGYEMIGVLDNQASYYLNDYKQIQKEIYEKANDIMNELTLRTNVSLTAPLEQ